MTAARDTCDLVWVIDTDDPRLDAMPRLLARFGPVVDIAGLSSTDAAAAISPLEVDGVLALSDELLERTAAVAAVLGRPFLGAETAHRLTDKFAQRSALRAAGLAAPGCWVVNAHTTDPEWTGIGAAATFPGVLKPRRGEGSRNTAFVASLSEARAVVDASAADEPRRDWVLEEYIPDLDGAPGGTGFAGYVSVETFVCDGVVNQLAVTGRTPPAWPFRETGFFIPAAVDAPLAESLKEVAAAASAALGVTLGCLHTEIKLTPDGPVVIEVNGRIGGGIPELLALTTDVDFLRIALRLAVGEKIRVEEPQPHGVGYLLYVQAPPELHRVTSVTGLTELRAVPGVEEITMNRGPGLAVDWRDGNHGHVYSVLGAVADHDALRQMLDRVPRTVTIAGESV